MTHKVHPFAFRLGIVTNWKARWFKTRDYADFLEQDVKLRSFLNKKLARNGVNVIETEYSANCVNIIVKTSRPGLIIGRGGGGAEALKKEIRQMLQKGRTKALAKLDVRLEIEEVRNPTACASIIGEEVAGQLEKRMPYRRSIKQALDKIMQNQEVKGAKISVSGPLSGPNSIARTEWLKKGRVRLQTLRSDIDFARVTAKTIQGTIGVKVWIYKGEVFNQKK